MFLSEDRVLGLLRLYFLMLFFLILIVHKLISHNALIVSPRVARCTKHYAFMRGLAKHPITSRDVVMQVLVTAFVIRVCAIVQIMRKNDKPSRQ